MNPLLLLLAAGCHLPTPTVANGLSFLEVTSEPVGSADAPADFTSDGLPVSVRVQALDRDASPLSLNARFTLSSRPGSVVGEDSIDVVNGTWEGTVTVKNGFGPTRIWVSDDLEKDTSREHTWITGVSDELWFDIPTIAQVQYTTDTETNQLEGEFSVFKTEGRQVAITYVSTDGFWAADLSSTWGEYNGLFVYTFNKPDYELTEGTEDSTNVYEGDHLGSLDGSNQEYLATTQISFPTFTKADTSTLTIPDPIVLTETTACDPAEMEKVESLPVRVEDVQVPADFTSGSTSEDYSDYLAYGQWPIQVGDCTIYVESTTTIPDFDPTEYAGKTLTSVEGMLSEVWGKIIIRPRSEADLVASGGASRPKGPPLTTGMRQLPPRPASR